jgi:hypothetical protein
MSDETAVSQDKLVLEMYVHFQKVFEASADRVRNDRATDSVIQVMDICITDLLRLNQSPLGMGVFLLMLARSNNDIRSMVETMLLHADKRKEEGIWP